MRALCVLVMALGCGGHTPLPVAAPVPAPVPPPPAPVVFDAHPDPATLDPAIVATVTNIVDAFANTQPLFLRDGKSVVFVSNRDGLPQLYTAGKPDEPATRLVTTTERI